MDEDIATSTILIQAPIIESLDTFAQSTQDNNEELTFNTYSSSNSKAKREILTSLAQLGQFRSLQRILKSFTWLTKITHRRVYGKLLHVAVENNQIEVIKVLLEEGANINFQDKQRKTVLHKAVENNSLEMVTLLAQPSTVNFKTYHGRSALQMSAESGNSEIFRLLLDTGAKCMDKDIRGNTCLHFACHSTNLEILELLLKHFDNVNVVNGKGETPLHIAAMFGHIDVVNMLLQNKAQINVKDNAGLTPLHVATLWSFLDIAKLLIRNGAGVDTENSDYKYFPSYFEPLWEDEEITQTLLKNSGNTAIHYCLIQKAGWCAGDPCERDPSKCTVATDCQESCGSGYCSEIYTF